MSAAPIRWTALAVVTLSYPLASHAAMAASSRWPALCLAVLQAMAAGPLLWSALPERWRRLALLVPSVLLAAAALGALHSARDGMLAVAGLGHACLYLTLFIVFARSLRADRVSIVTGLAKRLNPRFRPGMVRYTRRVTALWCGFFLGQLMLSAGLLALGPVELWLLLVTTLHGPMVAALGLGEFAVRCLSFPGEHTGLRDTIIGIRASAARAGAKTSGSGADCPGRSGNATRRPPTSEDSRPGPAP